MLFYPVSNKLKNNGTIVQSAEVLKESEISNY